VTVNLQRVLVFHLGNLGGDMPMLCRGSSCTAACILAAA
jgi:hypothetical protein